MKTLKKLLFNHPAPWWQFWNPYSGPIGGLIFGALLFLAMWPLL